MTTVDIEVMDIRKIIVDGNLKAFADVKIAGSFLVKGFSVMQSKRGIFVSMPRRASKDGKWYDMFEALEDDLKQELQDKVLEAYEREVDGAAV